MTARYLLDTNVLSEMTKRHPSPQVLLWMERYGGYTQYISTVTIGEVRKGIALLQTASPQKAQQLESWLRRIYHQYSEHILSIDTEIAERWGELMAIYSHQYVDGFIAATAIEHGLTVATRNTRHFTEWDVPIINPFEETV